MQTEKLSTAEVLAELDRRMMARANEQIGEATLPFLLSASVLHVFDPATLVPWKGLSRRIGPIEAVFDYSMPAIGYSHLRLRSLKPEIRRRALGWLWQYDHRAAMREVLEANDAYPTDVQVMFAKWLREETPELSTQSFDELRALGQLYDWGLSEFGGLPDRTLFDRFIRRRSSVSLFEHLVDETFVGREQELQSLRTLVGVVAPSIWERLRSFVGIESQPPMVMWGPGGIGKTALVGKFLLEHVNAPQSGWFPFSYLAFDSETVDIREPFTILVGITSQLESQVPEGNPGRRARSAIQNFRQSVDDYRSGRDRLRRRASVTRNRSAELSNAEESLYRSFGSMLGEIAQAAGEEQGASQVPVLLVFDTFEEVFYRAQEEFLGFWRMLENAQSAFPRIRIIISGRIQPRASWISSVKAVELPLANLNAADAQRLLFSLGVTDSAVAQALVRQLGGSPLTLRLAARVAESEDVAGGIKGIETRRFWIFSVAQSVVQGQLYRRILDHIHEPDVRALAHPGMVLRRVNVEIIRGVLSPLCGLGEIDQDRAEDLFDSLRREHALVSIESDNSLRYREEVRQPVLALLMNDKPDQVREIQEAVVAFYLPSETVVDRAEEIYNRLMLKQADEDIEGRWLSGVENFLYSSVNELPVEQQIWLAGRMSIELPPATYQLADLSSWERLIGRKALDAFRFGGPKDAIALLKQRNDRSPDSPLFAIEARAWLALDFPRDAMEVTGRALENYPAMGNRGRLAEILWLRAQAALRLQAAEEAYVCLERLVDVAKNLSSRLTGVQGLSEILALSKPSSSIDDLHRQELSDSLNCLSEAEIQKERDLLRLTLVRLGADYPKTVAKIAPRVADGFLQFLRNGVLSVGDISVRFTKYGDFFKNPIADPNDAQPQQREILEAAVRQVLGIVERGDGPPQVTALLLDLFATEDASLASASLAGLDSYREVWEREAASEVVS
jgi:tetratricopeptide (TPR) repeat protein